MKTIFKSFSLLLSLSGLKLKIPLALIIAGITYIMMLPLSPFVIMGSTLINTAVNNNLNALSCFARTTDSHFTHHGDSECFSKYGYPRKINTIFYATIAQVLIRQNITSGSLNADDKAKMATLESIFDRDFKMRLNMYKSPYKKERWDLVFKSYTYGNNITPEDLSSIINTVTRYEKESRINFFLGKISEIPNAQKMLGYSDKVFKEELDKTGDLPGAFYSAGNIKSTSFFPEPWLKVTDYSNLYSSFVPFDILLTTSKFVYSVYLKYFVFFIYFLISFKFLNAISKKTLKDVEDKINSIDTKIEALEENKVVALNNLIARLLASKQHELDNIITQIDETNDSNTDVTTILTARVSDLEKLDPSETDKVDKLNIEIADLENKQESYTMLVIDLKSEKIDIQKNLKSLRWSQRNNVEPTMTSECNSDLFDDYKLKIEEINEEIKEKESLIDKNMSNISMHLSDSEKKSFSGRIVS